MKNHGHNKSSSKRTKTYNSWRKMRERCLNPNAIQYKHYGARGISICEEWNDFRKFLNDMGERPNDKTLDRINVNGNYELNNCRWASRSEQRRNTRASK